MWFRRDLRLGDNPALVEAAADGPVLPLFVLDPALWGPAGPSRRAYLGASLRALDGQLRQRRTRLSVVRGDPVRRVVLAAKAVGAERVHVAADFGPYGARRDRAVEEALADAGVELVRTGSPYAVAPGRVRNGSGDPYKVFTPFSKAWAEHGWRGPVDPPSGGSWLELDEDTTDIPDPELPDGLELPEAGEAAALRRWREFLPAVGDYDDLRDDPGRDATSRMSVHLKYGEIHPRTMLADLAPLRSAGAATYRKELAWREFYADVLHADPRTAREYLRTEYKDMPYDQPGSAFEAWKRGRTGFPIVDAGMRQLRRLGLDAQPGPDDRGELPGQGPAPGVAARRPALHAVARGRRPRVQPARLAVDGRLRHRRGAVLPGLQPHRPEPEVRPTRATTSGDGSRSSRTPRRCRTRTSRTQGYAARWAIPHRSSTTPRSAARRSPAGSRSGRPGARPQGRHGPDRATTPVCELWKFPLSSDSARAWSRLHGLTDLVPPPPTPEVSTMASKPAVSHRSPVRNHPRPEPRLPHALLHADDRVMGWLERLYAGRRERARAARPRRPVRARLGAPQPARRAGRVHRGGQGRP